MQKQTLQSWIGKGEPIRFFANEQRSPEKRKKQAYASFVFILSLCFFGVSGQNIGFTNDVVFGQESSRPSESRNAKFARAEITPSVGLRVVSSSLMTVQDEGSQKRATLDRSDVLTLDHVQTGSTKPLPFVRPRPISSNKETQEESLKNSSNEKLKRQIVKLAIELENPEGMEEGEEEPSRFETNEDDQSVQVDGDIQEETPVQPETTSKAKAPSEEKDPKENKDLPKRLAVVEEEEEEEEEIEPEQEEIQASEPDEEESEEEEEGEVEEDEEQEYAEDESELETAPLPFMSSESNDEEEEGDEDEFDESTAGFATSAGVAVSSTPVPVNVPAPFPETQGFEAYVLNTQLQQSVYPNGQNAVWQAPPMFVPQQAPTTVAPIIATPALRQPIMVPQQPTYTQQIQRPQTPSPAPQTLTTPPMNVAPQTFVQPPQQRSYAIGQLANAAAPKAQTAASQYAPNIQNAPVRQYATASSIQTRSAVSGGVQPSQYVRPQAGPKINAETRRINDSFYAKEPNYPGVPNGGKVFRSFDESSLQPNTRGATRPAGAFNLNAPNRSTSPFAGNIAPTSALESSTSKRNPIVQTSATIVVSEENEVVEEDVLPEAPIKGNRRIQAIENSVPPQNESNTPVEQVEKKTAKFVETSSPKNVQHFYVDEQPQDDVVFVAKSENDQTTVEQPASNVVIANNVSEEFVVEERQEPDLIFDDDGESGRFFPNLRPFKRARQRLLAGRLVDAPNPPNVEEIELNKDSVQIANEPLLTKENPNLPPLAVKVDGKYGDEVVDDVVTRADLNALREEAKGFAWTKGDLKIVPYGFLNLSVSSDTQRGVPGEYMLYAQSPDVDDSADFSVDARTSRLGLKISGPRIERLNSVLGGCVEFDFQGYPNGSKNKGGVQLRRAYAELVDEQHDRKFLAGQDWEIISPAAPQMLNYLPAGFAGDMQYRRGQIRFEQGWKVSSDLKFLGQIAACDDVISDYSSTVGVTPSSAGWPILEMRLATSLFQEALNGRPIVMGVSGHVGEQYYKFSPIAGTFAATSERTAIKTWSTNFDFEAPIAEKHKIQGEYFIGSNLSTFCGGINQGVDLYRREGIGDSGGWIALHSDWTKKFATNVGYGLDKPDRDDLVGTSLASNGFATSRTRNEVYFLNFIYNWTPNFMTGLENSYWKTDYQKADVSGAEPVFYSMKSGESVRTEFVTRLSF